MGDVGCAGRERGVWVPGVTGVGICEGEGCAREGRWGCCGGRLPSTPAIVPSGGARGGAACGITSVTPRGFARQWMCDIEGWVRWEWAVTVKCDAADMGTVNASWGNASFMGEIGYGSSIWMCVGWMAG